MRDHSDWSHIHRALGSEMDQSLAKFSFRIAQWPQPTENSSQKPTVLADGSHTTVVEHLPLSCNLL